MAKPPSPKFYKVVSNALLVGIICINLYIIITPFIPKLMFLVQSNHGQTARHLSQSMHKAVAAPAVQHQPNHVTIPSMLLDQPVLEGMDTYAILNKGIWRWPDSSTPDKGGNTVLIGHRFTYTNPRGVFYFLDKVAINDEIGVWWQDKQYIYKVKSVQVVPPSQTSILATTAQPTLTLYTCTPLWNPKDRLVVTALLETSEPSP